MGHRKRLWLTGMISLGIVGTAAHAEDWREFKRSNEVVGALNVADVRKSGSSVEFSMLIVPKAQPLAPVPLYTIVDVRADCAARTAQVVGAQNFAGAMPVGERTQGDPDLKQSKGDGLDLICDHSASLSSAPSTWASTAFNFALNAWSPVIASPPAAAQTQGMEDRLNRIIRLVAAAPLCGKLGMKLDVYLPFKAGALLQSETGDAASYGRLTSEASRQRRILDDGLRAAAHSADTDPQLRGAKKIFLGYGQTCIAATKDPVLSALIAIPAGYDLEAAVDTLATSLLKARRTAK